jgi:hypothetical protein
VRDERLALRSWASTARKHKKSRSQRVFSFRVSRIFRLCRMNKNCTDQKFHLSGTTSSETIGSIDSVHFFKNGDHLPS